MSNIVKFDYQGASITFNNNDAELMINATQMAKPFGKQVGHFLENNSTESYKEAIKARYRLSDEDVLVAVKGGFHDKQGTWMHRLLALEFARWLSPEFSLWCNERILDIMNNRATATDVITEIADITKVKSHALRARMTKRVLKRINLV